MDTDTPATKTLWQRLLEVQKKVKHAPFDSKNPHFKSNYASLSSVLDAVKPIANEHGIVITQRVNPARKDYFGDSVIVKTTLACAETGEVLEDDLLVPLAKSDPQGLGSAITYGRRYGLLAMFAIAQDDDDGEAASNTKPQAEKNPAQPPKNTPIEAMAKEEIQNKLSNVLGFNKNAPPK